MPTSKSVGMKFEGLFKKSVQINNKFSLVRLKDNSMTQRNGEWIKLKNTNPCDFIVYNGLNLFFIELKSVKGKSFPLSNIKEHQEQGMYLEQSRKGGQLGYLVIEFREVNKVIYINIEHYFLLLSYLELQNKKSFSYIEMLNYGGVEIPLYTPQGKKSLLLDLTDFLKKRGDV